MTREQLKKVRITLCIMQTINLGIWLSSSYIGFLSRIVQWYQYVVVGFTILFCFFILFQYYFFKPDKE